MSRKLVTIREVAELMEIPGADQIECAVVDGWTVVVKKGEFKAGDFGVFFEIDSFLPATDPRFLFLERNFRDDHLGRRGARLRTIKLRKQLSQGLMLPLSLFPEIAEQDIGMGDFSELLGVILWEPKMPACLSGIARGNFPSFIRKTDQERVQNMRGFDFNSDGWEITQKLDGSSMTVYHRDGDFGVCSRNLDLEETEGNSFWNVANRYSLREALALLKFNVALQGELIGEGIQGNPEKISGQDFYLFDVWWIDEGCYSSPKQRHEFLNDLNLLLKEPIKHVPVLAKDHFFCGSSDGAMEMALFMADRKSELSYASAEGIVFKSQDGRKSFKAISNNYLMKERDEA